MKPENVRITVAALSLSAAAFIGLVVHEGYTDRAVIPTKGDVPTIGFGSTRYEDGRPVRLTDPPITRRRGRSYYRMHRDGCNAASPTSPPPSFTPAHSAP